MYATADLWSPHSSTGMFLNRTKPLPLRSSSRSSPEKYGPSVGRGKSSYNNVISAVLPTYHLPNRSPAALTWLIAVIGLPVAIYPSAAFPNSSISSGVKGLVHLSFLRSKSLLLHSVRPWISFVNTA
jgi:hypothetical protein